MIDLGKKLHHRLFDSEHRTSRSMNRFLKSERSRKTVIPCISFIIYLIIVFEKKMRFLSNILFILHLKKIDYELYGYNL